MQLLPCTFVGIEIFHSADQAAGDKDNGDLSVESDLQRAEHRWRDVADAEGLDHQSFRALVESKFDKPTVHSGIRFQQWYETRKLGQEECLSMDRLSMEEDMLVGHTAEWTEVRTCKRVDLLCIGLCHFRCGMDLAP